MLWLCRRRGRSPPRCRRRRCRPRCRHTPSCCRRRGHRPHCRRPSVNNWFPCYKSSFGRRIVLNFDYIILGTD